MVQTAGGLLPARLLVPGLKKTRGVSLRFRRTSAPGLLTDAAAVSLLKSRERFAVFLLVLFLRVALHTASTASLFLCTLKSVHGFRNGGSGDLKDISKAITGLLA